LAQGLRILFLVGNSDQTLKPKRIKKEVTAFPASTTVDVTPGAVHSGKGQEEELVQRMVQFLAQAM